MEILETMEISGHRLMCHLEAMRIVPYYYNTNNTNNTKEGCPRLGLESFGFEPWPREVCFAGNGNGILT